MKLADFVERWGRALFEAPLAAAARQDEPPELAEIRLAILDKVHEKSYRAGARKVFPFDLVRVELRGVEREQHGIFTGRFFHRYLEREVRNALRDGGCRFPENLRVEVQATVGLPQPGEAWLTVEAASQSPDGGAAPGAARLVVREGPANAAEIALAKPRTNIGRTVDVYRSTGLARRNDLTFEEDTEINRTVSREHAHILFDRAAGEYRLFNDRRQPRGESRPAEAGTWIVRDGMSLEVNPDARGIRLQPGDEIHFGRAVVVFEWETGLGIR
jgi:hypothetical protein